MTDAPRPPSTIVVVEDDPELQYLLSAILSGEGRRVVLTATAEAGRRALAAESPDLLVLDLILPDADGRTLLRSLRTAPETASLPVVVLTSRVGREVRAECYDLGADAFVEKPFDPQALAAEVTARLGQAATRSRVALTDARTGLLNLAGLLHAAGRARGRPHALVVVHVDGLRALADRRGWDAAEAVEAEVARVLEARVSPHVVARVGAGDFAALFGGVDQPDVDTAAAAAASAALAWVRDLAIAAPDGETFHVTASTGWASSADPEDGSLWLEDTRSRVVRASEAGGNRVAGRDDARDAGGEAPLVLVAEDDDITARILEHRLAREGFRVLRFNDGQEAYRGALAQTPALVVLDVKMPGMDGFELLERLRRTPSYASVPIMMLTSLGSEADVVRGFALGADDYMPKPFSPGELLARLRRLLRHGGS